jgi:hypothetical protein
MMVINHSKQLIILSLVAMLLLLHDGNQPFETANHPVINCDAAAA